MLQFFSTESTAENGTIVHFQMCKCVIIVIIVRSGCIFIHKTASIYVILTTAQNKNPLLINLLKIPWIIERRFLCIFYVLFNKLRIQNYAEKLCAVRNINQVFFESFSSFSLIFSNFQLLMLPKCCQLQWCNLSLL